MVQPRHDLETVFGTIGELQMEERARRGEELTSRRSLDRCGPLESATMSADCKSCALY